VRSASRTSSGPRIRFCIVQRLEPAGDVLGFRFERALQREIDVGFGFEELVQLTALIHAFAQGV